MPNHKNCFPVTWIDLMRAWEVSVTAPQVMSLRAFDMLRRDPHADDLLHMSSEKLHAFGEAWMAMVMEAWLYWLRLGSGIASRGPHAVTTTALPNVLGHGLRPLHRTVMANHRRLSRRRRTS
jgi:hypothetical protein